MCQFDTPEQNVFHGHFLDKWGIFFRQPVFWGWYVYLFLFFAYANCNATLQLHAGI